MQNNGMRNEGSNTRTAKQSTINTYTIWTTNYLSKASHILIKHVHQVFSNWDWLHTNKTLQPTLLGEESRFSILL